MMCVADSYAVVCLASLDKEEERRELENILMESGKEIIEISEKQMHQFAANMLQVQNREGTKFLVMSESAHDTFTNAQLGRLIAHNSIITAGIPNIERVGGGGVRCMMAEVFCPRLHEV